MRKDALISRRRSCSVLIKHLNKSSYHTFTDTRSYIEPIEIIAAIEQLFHLRNCRSATPLSGAYAHLLSLRKQSDISARLKKTNGFSWRTTVGQPEHTVNTSFANCVLPPTLSAPRFVCGCMATGGASDERVSAALGRFTPFVFEACDPSIALDVDEAPCAGCRPSSTCGLAVILRRFRPLKGPCAFRAMRRDMPFESPRECSRVSLTMTAVDMSTKYIFSRLRSRTSS